MAAIKGPKPVEADNFVVEHVASEGRALAVTTTYSATHQSDSVSASASASAESTSIGRTYQSLEELIAKAMSPYIEKIPDVSVVLHFVDICCRVAVFDGHSYLLALSVNLPNLPLVIVKRPRV